MRHLFDFGISQEDPLTEQHILNIQPGEKILCVASGGEVPLTLACLNPEARFTAVDISGPQLKLCRLKLQAALALPFPINGAFLGYSDFSRPQRWSLYRDIIRDFLPEEDRQFWDEHPKEVEVGVVNAGRFEQYLRKPAWLARRVIGYKNLQWLLLSATVEAQTEIFDRYIAPRRLLKGVFRIAFHPKIYKNRGLRSQALQHASTNTGAVFFSKFRSFCTATPVRENYFFQYFLLGKCFFPEGLPDFLQPHHHEALVSAYQRISWRCTSMEEELAANPAGTYQKIHLSNIGDWMDEAAFDRFLPLLESSCRGGERICYRYLQKNHLVSQTSVAGPWTVEAVPVENSDRFPFYTVLSMQYHGRLPHHTR